MRQQCIKILGPSRTRPGSARLDATLSLSLWAIGNGDFYAFKHFHYKNCIGQRAVGSGRGGECKCFVVIKSAAIKSIYVNFHFWLCHHPTKKNTTTTITTKRSQCHCFLIKSEKLECPNKTLSRCNKSRHKAAPTTSFDSSASLTLGQGLIFHQFMQFIK